MHEYQASLAWSEPRRASSESGLPSEFSSGSLMVKLSAHNRRDTGSSPEQSIYKEDWMIELLYFLVGALIGVSIMSIGLWIILRNKK